jgi:hypothetical protein
VGEAAESAENPSTRGRGEAIFRVKKKEKRKIRKHFRHETKVVPWSGKATGTRFGKRERERMEFGFDKH